MGECGSVDIKNRNEDKLAVVKTYSHFSFFLHQLVHAEEDCAQMFGGQELMHKGALKLFLGRDRVSLLKVGCHFMHA